MYQYDFMQTARALRELIQQAHPLTRAATWTAAEGAEAQMAAECVAFLYEHLCAHEQYTAAAHLLAWALPTSVRGDPRITAALKHASDIAATLDEPTKELIAYRANVHAIEDAFAASTAMVTQRGKYWIRSTRLFCSERPNPRAAEFGAGCGSNVMHAVQLAPEVEWTGIDVSAPQIDWCRASALRLKLPSQWAVEPAPALYGQFDSIALLDVLEHTVHPLLTLEAAEKYVRPGGIMTVSVPRGPWSLHTINTASAGNHVNVSTIGALIALAEKRGRVLAADILTGPVETEANASALVTYQVPG